MFGLDVVIRIALLVASLLGPAEREEHQGPEHPEPARSGEAR